MGLVPRAEGITGGSCGDGGGRDGAPLLSLLSRGSSGPGSKQPLSEVQGDCWLREQASQDGSAAEKVPFPHLMGQELAAHILPGEGSAGSGAEVERGAKSVGGERGLKEQGRRWEERSHSRSGHQSPEMRKAIRWPFLAFVKNWTLVMRGISLGHVTQLRKYQASSTRLDFQN